MSEMKHYFTAKLKLGDIENRDDLGVFEGYAAMFNELVPSYNEIVKPGAFKQTHRANGGKVPILYMHDPFELPVGMGLAAEEQEHGYYVQGGLNIRDNAKSLATYSFIKLAAELKRPAGLSIGFKPIKWKAAKDSDSGASEPTEITELKLFEYSITPPDFQAAPNATAREVRANYDAMVDFMLELGVHTPALDQWQAARQAATEVTVKPSDDTSLQPSLDMALLISVRDQALEVVRKLSER